MKPGRIPCVVPFCKRTADAAKMQGSTEIICGKHARMAPATLRRRYRKLFRRYRARIGGEFWDHPEGSAPFIEGIRLARILDKLWDRYRRAVIERAAGL